MSDEYADKALWSDNSVMNKSFKKILKSQALKTDPCGTSDINSKKVLYTLLMQTDAVNVSCSQDMNESDFLSKP